MALKVVLTTGGTGGHIFPALAVAQALKRRLPDAHILFVGGQYGPEGELALQAGLDFEGLPVRGMLGRGWKAIPAVWAMLLSVGRAFSLLHERKPDVIMGFGGYAAFAAVFAGWLKGRPTGIHEQNAVPGTANRLLGKLVRRVCLSWPDSKGSFAPDKCVLTGNPIRQDIVDTTEKQPDRHRPCLLVMGGSQGARAINSLIITQLARLRDAGINILHQTGPHDLVRVREAYKAHGYSPEDVEDMVTPFIHDMAAAYSHADLALCRAGASTLAELAATGTPSILIPFPFAIHDHQTGNAQAMQEAGGAVLIPEDETEGKDMAGLILGLLTDRERLADMGRKARTLARLEAADAVAEELIRLATLRAG